MQAIADQFTASSSQEGTQFETFQIVRSWMLLGTSNTREKIHTMASCSSMGTRLSTTAKLELEFRSFVARIGIVCRLPRDWIVPVGPGNGEIHHWTSPAV